VIQIFFVHLGFSTKTFSSLPCMLHASPFLSSLIWSHNYVVSHLVSVVNEPDL